MNSSDLTEVWTKITGKPPLNGDLLPHDETLYQFRNGWVKICPLEQPDLGEDEGLLWGVGDTFIRATGANLIAVAVEIARYDPRASLEDLVQTVYKIIDEEGWKNPRRETEGTIRASRIDADYVWESVNFDSVLEQFESGSDRIRVEQKTGAITFVNPSDFFFVKCIPSEK